MTKQNVGNRFHYSDVVGHYVGASAMLCEICRKELEVEEMSVKEPTCASCRKDYADAAKILRKAALESFGDAKYKLWRAAHICDSPVAVSEWLCMEKLKTETEQVVMKREAIRLRPPLRPRFSGTLAWLLNKLPFHPMRYPESVWRYAHPIAPARY